MINMVTVDFKSIHNDMDVEAQDCHLLSVPEEKLIERFNQGRSIVLVVGNEVVGNISITPLLDSEMKQYLGLETDFPEIYEIGSVIINENYRGRHYSEEMLASLLRTQLGLQDNGVTYSEDAPTLRFNDSQTQEHTTPTLFISTTKNMRFVETECKVSRDLGLNFAIVTHNTYQNIGPFTCICTPTNGGGHGVQYGRSCEMMINGEELEVINPKASIERGETGCKCIMYVSDRELAATIDQRLHDEVGTQENLVRALIRKEYFS